MKRLSLILILISVAAVLSAQVIGGVQTKLQKFYEEERWEDCAFKADRMVLQEKYKNDPEVNLYLGASYAKIFLMCLEDSSLLNKVPEYLNSYSYALKYSLIAKKKDKKAKIIFPKNDFMLEEIAITGIYYIDHYMSIKKIAKANSYLRKMMKVYSDINFDFLGAVFSVSLGDTVNGTPIIKDVFSKMDNERPSKPSNTDFIMIDAFDYYINFLINKEIPLYDSAKNVANRGLKYFPDSEVFKYYLQLINNPELESKKPKNERKQVVLKNVALNNLNDDKDENIDDNDDDD